MAGTPPIKTYQAGCVQLAVWAGEYEGKPTTSYTLKKQKYNKETKTWEDSGFLSATDLKDILIVCQMALLEKYQPEPDF